ncbi:uncharacterized protein VTP21DRAFT_7512 [Calcarisporiella thermophila]|uniref:uncharacterized protein n=1 Tax=Calcarisporiella thermophila TaxID=911321 RepID=UPI0037447F21
MPPREGASRPQAKAQSPFLKWTSPSGIIDMPNRWDRLFKTGIGSTFFTNEELIKIETESGGLSSLLGDRPRQRRPLSRASPQPYISCWPVLDMGLPYWGLCSSRRFAEAKISIRRKRGLQLRKKDSTDELLSPHPNMRPSLQYSLTDEEGKPYRKKSLVRPERLRVDISNRLFHYLTRVTKSSPDIPLSQPTRMHSENRPLSAAQNGPRGNGIGLFRERTGSKRHSNKRSVEFKCSSCWILFCYAITFFAPPILLAACGKKNLQTQRAWREKMGLLFIIFLLCAMVGFISFGLSKALCSYPSRIRTGSLEASQVIINGDAYDLSQVQHPPIDNVQNPNLLYLPVNATTKDISFLFQNVNRHCFGLLKVKNGVNWGQNELGQVPNYFPCVILDPQQPKQPEPLANPQRKMCHLSNQARAAYRGLKPVGELYYTWEDVQNPSAHLIVYNNNVLNLDLLRWLPQGTFDMPSLFQYLLDPVEADKLRGSDVTHLVAKLQQQSAANCLVDIIRVGVLDARPFGCLVSDAVLYLILVVVLGVVMSKFVLAVLFGWLLSWKLGNFKKGSREERRRREEEIENWAKNIQEVAPAIRPTHRAMSSLFNRLSRAGGGGEKWEGGGPDLANGLRSSFLYPHSPHLQSSTASSATTTPGQSPNLVPTLDSDVSSHFNLTLTKPVPCPIPLSPYVVPQPAPDYAPFGFHLLHTICLVTCYSEGEEGIRTTLDSLATTDYPNSHKLLLVIADGKVTGAGNSKSTPEIVLEMMQDLIVPADQVQPQSCLAIAEGAKRHNMAKVYAGYYRYDPRTVRRSRQQRVPMVLIEKCGTPEEQGESKPGNRGKRDSQIMLMGWLQKVIFDERMTMFEYELFNSVWSVSGVCPDKYELLLMVDADTKVFPDSLSRMVACMARDASIMGLCGETKISNKTQSWVTMIQVFEYYISHHLSKAFESVFGGVTCLPGCFCMYRIKAPKGCGESWVPLLANPDIVVKYSENVVDTLHKKNLLLLGEDRYLTTLMLSTFPKRKIVFVPQAVCKTVVPDEFQVLLSQRRRWINSTVHNLMELVLVRDLCGTFCFSMQFIVFLELIGTVVLPAAICFTVVLIIYTVYTLLTSTVTPESYVALILLALILGLPALLIAITTRKVVYIGWMLIYLVSLPIWNFVLPVYAFWHFDDFSWGQTRLLAGESPKSQASHGDDGGESEALDHRRVVMRRWADFEKERRIREAKEKGLPPPKFFEDDFTLAPPRSPYLFGTDSGVNSSAESVEYVGSTSSCRHLMGSSSSLVPGRDGRGSSVKSAATGGEHVAMTTFESHAQGDHAPTLEISHGQPHLSQASETAQDLVPIGTLSGSKEATSVTTSAPHAQESHEATAFAPSPTPLSAKPPLDGAQPYTSLAPRPLPPTIHRGPMNRYSGVISAISPRRISSHGMYNRNSLQAKRISTTPMLLGPLGAGPGSPTPLDEAEVQSRIRHRTHLFEGSPWSQVENLKNSEPYPELEQATASKSSPGTEADHNQEGQAPTREQTLQNEPTQEHDQVQDQEQEPEPERDQVQAQEKQQEQEEPEPRELATTNAEEPEEVPTEGAHLHEIEDRQESK